MRRSGAASRRSRFRVGLATVQGEGISHAMVVPTMLARVVEHLGAADAGCGGLRSLAYGGARMPATVLERALRAFGCCGVSVRS